MAAILMALIGVCAAHASEKRALLIGISDYAQHEAKELRWAPIHGANDISLIEGTLRRQGFTITALADSEATAANVRKAFARLVAECRAGDMVYVHFSGHGQAYEDLSGDEDDGWDEALVPYDALRGYRRGVYEGEKHIVDDELGAVFDALRTKVGPKGYVYAVLDACHSGGAARGDEMQDDELFVRGTDHGFTPQRQTLHSAHRPARQHRRSAAGRHERHLHPRSLSCLPNQHRDKGGRPLLRAAHILCQSCSARREPLARHSVG